MPHHQEMGYTESAQSHLKRPLIELRQVSKVYQTPSGTFTALRDISLGIQREEWVAIVGKSGSDKSTRINLITRIDLPSRVRSTLREPHSPTAREPACSLGWAHR